MRNLAIAFLFFAACTSGSSGTTPDGPGSGSATLSCATYCSAIVANCTGTNVQYDGMMAMAKCMGTCATFPMGTAADTSGNTLGCRIYHANNAKTDPTTHCIHAGPSGAGVCGMPCEGFCSIVDSVCPTQYPAGTCAGLCAGYAATPAYTSPATGNNLSCRLYHATNASADAMSAMTHCPHTGSDGGGVCI